MGQRLESSSWEQQPYLQSSAYEGYAPTLMETEPQPLSPNRRGVLDWVGLVLSVPFRLFGLGLLLFLPSGIHSMWVLTQQADERNVDLTLVSLRALHLNKPVQPLLPLGYRPAVQKKLIDIQPEYGFADLASDFATFFSDSLYTERCITEKKPDGTYKHEVHFSDGTTRTIASTTIHTTLSPEEITEARQGLVRLFPDNDLREKYLHWGKNLFFVEWLEERELGRVSRDVVPEPWMGTEAERTWIVWQVLVGGRPEAEADLQRLPELFRSAFPEQADRKAAYDWAKTLYARMADDYGLFQKYARRVDEAEANKGANRLKGDIARSELAKLNCVLPPESEWTYLWLLYRYVGLDEGSRAAARAHWLSLFPLGHEQEILQWGESLVAERRAGNEPLPPVKETLPLLCVIERLTWTDDHGLRCRYCVDEVTDQNKSTLRNLVFGIEACYPNDETFYLVMSKDPLAMMPRGEKNTDAQRCQRLVELGIFPLLASLGVATLLHFIIVPLIMGGEARKLWDRHCQGRGFESLWMWLLSVVGMGALGAVLAPYSLPQSIGLQVESFGDMFLASMMATAVGGVLIGTCRRIFAVILTLFLVDIEETWFDEVLGIMVGSYILYFFGNSLFAIVLFALTDLLPGVIYTLVYGNNEAPRTSTTPMSEDYEAQWR